MVHGLGCLQDALLRLVAAILWFEIQRMHGLERISGEKAEIWDSLGLYDMGKMSSDFHLKAVVLVFAP